MREYLLFFGGIPKMWNREWTDRKRFKLQMVRTCLEAGGLEGIVLTWQSNFAWLTGGANNYVYVGDAAGEASLLVTPRRSYLLTNNIEAPRLREEEVVDLPFEDHA